MTFGRINKKDLREMWSQYLKDIEVYIDDFDGYWYDPQYKKRGIYIGTKLIGFVFTKEKEVSEFYISSDYRRKRYGTMAVQLLSDELGEFRYYVLNRNKVGQAFWKAVTPNRFLIATDGRGEWYVNPKTYGRRSTAKHPAGAEERVPSQTQTESAGSALFQQLRLFPDVLVTAW